MTTFTPAVTVLFFTEESSVVHTVYTGSTVLHSTAQLCPYTKWYSSVFLSTTAFQLFLQWFKMFCSRVHLSSVADTRSSSFSAPSLLWIAPSLQPTPPHGIPLPLRPPPKCFIPSFHRFLDIFQMIFPIPFLSILSYIPNLLRCFVLSFKNESSLHHIIPQHYTLTKGALWVYCISEP